MSDKHERKRSGSPKPKHHNDNLSKWKGQLRHRPEQSEASKSTHASSKPGARHPCSRRPRSRPASEPVSRQHAKTRSSPREHPTACVGTKRHGTHDLGDTKALRSPREKHGHHGKKPNGGGAKLTSTRHTRARKEGAPLSARTKAHDREPDDSGLKLHPSALHKTHGKKDHTSPSVPASLSRRKDREKQVAARTRSEPIPRRHRVEKISDDAKSYSTRQRPPSTDATSTSSKPVARLEKIAYAGKSKTTQNDAEAHFVKAGCEVDATKLTLNGALRRSGTALDIASLVHHDSAQRIFANLRFPPLLIDLVYSLHKIVVCHNLPLDTWFTLPIKQISSTSYTWRNLKGTLKESSLASIMSLLCGTTPRSTWDVSVLHEPAELHTLRASGGGDFFRTIFKQFSREKFSENCSLQDMPRSIHDVIFLVLQTIAVLGTTLVHETLCEYAQKEPFAPAERIKPNLNSKSTVSKKKDGDLDSKSTMSKKKEEDFYLKPSVDAKEEEDLHSKPHVDAKKEQDLLVEPTVSTKKEGDLQSKSTVNTKKDEDVQSKSTVNTKKKENLNLKFTSRKKEKDFPSKSTVSKKKKEEKTPQPQKPSADAASVSTAKTKGSKGKGKSKSSVGRKTKDFSGTTLPLPESDSDDEQIARLLAVTTFKTQYEDSDDDDYVKGRPKKNSGFDSSYSSGDASSLSSWLSAKFQTTLCVPQSDSETDDDGIPTRVIETAEQMDLRVQSNTHFFNDIRVITTGTRGRPLNLAPWGVQLTIGANEKTATVRKWTSSELGGSKSEAVIGWELWHDVPEGCMVKITFIPEEGSTAFSVGDSVCKYIYKPSMKQIDFTDVDSKLYGKTEFVFAKTLGRGNPMCFMYRPPLVVVAPKTKVICIRNKTKDKKWITPRFKLNDLHRFVLETCPQRWNGYGGLHFFRDGKLDPKSNTVVEEVYFDDEPMEFTIELLDRNVKPPEELPKSVHNSPKSVHNSSSSSGYYSYDSYDDSSESD